MKIKYLGTAAAEGVPALFCTCDVCTYARKVKGKEIRTRAQSLINDDLLIDFGPDTFYHTFKDDLKLENIDNCIITHSHGDHLYLHDVMCRLPWFAKSAKENAFNIYGSESTYEILTNEINKYDDKSRIKAHLIKPYVPFKINNYEIIAIEAFHDPSSSPVNYIISDGKKTILYAHDTGMYDEKVFVYLKNSNIHFDLVSIDCTGSLLTNYAYHHLSYDMLLEVVKRLKEVKVVDDKTTIVANHFSHNGGATYEKMQEVASKDNVIVSYDGLEIEI